MSKENEPFFPVPLAAQDRTPTTVPQATQNSQIPMGLRMWFAASLIALMVSVAIALEVALSFSNRQKGWATSQVKSRQDGILHFAYTLPPIIIAMIIVTGWKTTDLGIKKMQPYIDLAHGNAAAEKTLLLDYTSTPEVIVWLSAALNKHYLVAVSALVVLFGLAAQPLAGALFVVRDTWFSYPNIPVQSVRIVGLNPDLTNLAPFVTAAGFAESKALYNISTPAFVQSNYVVADFDVLPVRNIWSNGTILVNTTAISTTANCVKADSVQVSLNNGAFTVTATGSGCSLSSVITTTSTTQFGSTMVTCGSLPDTQKPVAFWLVDSSASTTSPSTAVAFCTPSMRIIHATANVDIYTGLLAGVIEQPDNPYAIHNNVTDAPLNGAPLNGLAFNLGNNVDDFQRGRIAAVTSGLPGAIIQVAQQPGNVGVQGLFLNGGDAFAKISDQVYTLYLTLVAKEMYFIASNATTLQSEVRTWQKRLWMSGVATHILAVGLLVLALTSAFVHVAHARLRAPVTLAHRPGTLATALALASGHEHMPDARVVLSKRRFRIDPTTGRIVEQGQKGFEDAISPDPRQTGFLVA